MPPLPLTRSTHYPRPYPTRSGWTSRPVPRVTLASRMQATRVYLSPMTPWRAICSWRVTTSVILRYKLSLPQMGRCLESLWSRWRATLRLLHMFKLALIRRRLRMQTICGLSLLMRRRLQVVRCTLTSSSCSLQTFHDRYFFACHWISGYEI